MLDIDHFESKSEVVSTTQRLNYWLFEFESILYNLVLTSFICTKANINTNALVQQAFINTRYTAIRFIPDTHSFSSEEW